MNFRNSRRSAGVKGRAPCDLAIASNSSPVIVPLAGYTRTILIARFLAGLVGVEEAGVGFAGRFEVVDGMFKNLVES